MPCSFQIVGAFFSWESSADISDCLFNFKDQIHGYCPDIVRDDNISGLLLRGQHLLNPRFEVQAVQWFWDDEGGNRAVTFEARNHDLNHSAILPSTKGR
jgi:hypothetical protein